ncbi:S-layer homology domain-containing protein [Paenibacillus sp. SAF-054]|uniref:S-layer homology domain-containing protein n=1 Tax=unclassified Paenibacillus TaxID=185978 RepID=UPI003F7E64A5
MNKILVVLCAALFVWNSEAAAFSKGFEQETNVSSMDEAYDENEAYVEQVADDMEEGEEEEDEDEGIIHYSWGYETELSNHWASELFYWAIRHDIVKGYTEGSYKPDQPITEAEFLTVLYRACGLYINYSFYRDERGGQLMVAGGPYHSAERTNAPAPGLYDTALRNKPIDRATAAAIIAGAQGLNYEGERLYKYLAGQGLLYGDSQDIEQFEANRTLTRAEALRWVRQVIVKGMVNIQTRPKELSEDMQSWTREPQELQAWLPDFAAVEVSQEHFDMRSASGEPLIHLDDPKSVIEQRFGKPQEIVHNQGTAWASYQDFTIHYDKSDRVDMWRITRSDYETQIPQYRLMGDIQLEKSTLSDLLRQYGSFGFDGKSNIMSNYYEKQSDGHYEPLALISRGRPVRNPDQTYIISFSFDSITTQVEGIYVMKESYDDFVRFMNHDLSE